MSLQWFEFVADVPAVIPSMRVGRRLPFMELSQGAILLEPSFFLYAASVPRPKCQFDVATVPRVQFAVKCYWHV